MIWGIIGSAIAIGVISWLWSSASKQANGKR